MDVFGSSPTGKLNTLIRDGNRYLNNRLSVHRTLIDESSEKIENLLTDVQTLETRSNTQSETIDDVLEKINVFNTNTQTLENKTNTQSVLIDDLITSTQRLEKRIGNLEDAFEKWLESTDDTLETRDGTKVKRLKN